jgi:hypothetical protein
MISMFCGRLQIMSFYLGGYAHCFLGNYMLMVLEGQKGCKLRPYKVLLLALSPKDVGSEEIRNTG